MMCPRVAIQLRQLRNAGGDPGAPSSHVATRLIAAPNITQNTGAIGEPVASINQVTKNGAKLARDAGEGDVIVSPPVFAAIFSPPI